MFGRDSAHRLQIAPEGPDEKLGRRNGPHRNFQKFVYIVRHEKSFQAGEMVDHEDTGSIRNMVGAMKGDLGLG
jgi:hypothetical protein